MIDLKVISDTAEELIAGWFYYGLICVVANKKKKHLFCQIFRDVFSSHHQWRNEKGMEREGKVERERERI